MGSTGIRVRRSVSEKRRIVELSFLPGESVARVAQAEGVNSHQVFQWRRAYKRGELVEPGSSVLLPVLVPATSETDDDGRGPEQEKPSPTGFIHIELPGRALISVDNGADRALLRSILESLRK
jgi:transposase